MSYPPTFAYHAPTATEIRERSPNHHDALERGRNPDADTLRIPPPSPRRAAGSNIAGLNLLQAAERPNGRDLPINRAVVNIGRELEPLGRQPIQPAPEARQPEPRVDVEAAPEPEPVDVHAPPPPPNNINNGQGLWRTRANVGEWTGAIRPNYPRIRRPYGTNTREMFLGKRYTGMYTTGFDASVVESKTTPSFIPAQRKMVQDGAPAITDYIPALRSGGSEHVLFGVNHRR
jgi:hypothetical protein